LVRGRNVRNFWKEILGESRKILEISEIKGRSHERSFKILERPLKNFIDPQRPLQIIEDPLRSSESSTNLKDPQGSSKILKDPQKSSKILKDPK